MSNPPSRIVGALSGHYRLEEEIGAGGMATVYLAEDLRHDRRVAVKVLRPELAAVIGAERFLAEIKLTANLQHPHILPLFDSGEADSFLYYVMPFVEGESLRDRLRREKQLPVDEAVRLAGEVASALDYAHRHGVIHRDIKPENILLHDGRALVADFGIALAASKASGTRMTETGMSLGTPHYMSPEQAMGEREITARSDVYALGCVLYEMLTGDPPFTGSTAQAVVARVVTESPRPLVPQRHTIPPHVEAAVLTALEKLPADRFATAAMFAEALAHGSATVRQRPEAGLQVPAVAPRRRRRAALAVGALLLVGLAAAGSYHLGRGVGPGVLPARFAITIPADERLGQVEPIAALSPRGDLLAYSAEGTGGIPQVFVRPLNQLTPLPLPDTENGCCPSFSPDGQDLAFVQQGVFKRISPRGGAATIIPVTGDTRLSLLRWAGEDEFVVTTSEGKLARLGNDGGLRVIAAPDSAAGEATLDVMEVLPGGRILAVATVAAPTGRLIVLDPHNGSRAELPTGTVIWAGFSDGHLVWSQPGGLLYAAPFDPRHARITGPVQSLGITVQQTRGSRPKIAQLGHGALAYVPAQALSLVSVSREGRVNPLLDQPRSYHSPRVSPDARYIAFDFAENTRDVWLLDRHDSTVSRATFQNSGHDPTWLPNSREIVFAEARGARVGIVRAPVDGSRPADSVYYEGFQITVHAVTPDGRTGIAVRYAASGSNADIVAVPLEGGGDVKPLVATPYDEGYPALSPDGRWLAYASNEANRPEVYLRALDGAAGKVLVSQNGGSEPVWSRDGRELFYRSPGPGEPQLIAARVETRPSLRVVSRTPLFRVTDYEAATPHANYDVMPDGQSFVMVRQGRLSQFVYLQRWTALLPQQADAR
ncbi:MAG: protein kinase [Gemmatimonadales bacterium]|nr:protein kinase [Gemmatimonadales bacterium]